MGTTRGSSEPQGTIEFESPEGLPQGTLIVRVRNSSHIWRVHHETFTSSTVTTGSGEWSSRGRRYFCPPRAVSMLEPGDFHQNHYYSDGITSFDACLVPPSAFEAIATEAGVLKGNQHLRLTR